MLVSVLRFWGSLEEKKTKQFNTFELCIYLTSGDEQEVKKQQRVMWTCLGGYSYPEDVRVRETEKELVGDHRDYVRRGSSYTLSS